MSETITFNVMGDNEKLKAIAIQFPVAEVTERFAPTDWNFSIHPYQEEKFIEWCEENGLDCEFV